MEKSVRRGRLGWVAGFWLLAAPALGQPFEAVYGGPTSSDVGTKVIPVAACPGGGYVTVGSTRPPGLPSRVYALRFQANGYKTWERSYSVDPWGDSGAMSIAEARDGSGFIVAGYARFDRSRADILLLKIACDGGSRWAWTYDSSFVIRAGPFVFDVKMDDVAYDVVEAQYGDPASGTQPGDILVAGEADAPVDSEGRLGTASFMMRTRANGLLIWNRRYVSSPDEYFRALTEVPPAAGGGAGDVVAAGNRRSDFSEPTQGYAVRVSGQTGLIEASPHAAATYGGPDTEWLYSVVALRTGANAGQLAMVGLTWKNGSSSGVYLVRTGANPTALKAQGQIGGGLGGDSAFANEVREVLKATPLARAGDLALVGSASHESDSGAFLIVADSTSLEAVAGTGRLYGIRGGEMASSVAVHSGGFVISGDFEGIPPGDPNDVYLVGTDRWGHTSCDRRWDPASDDPGFEVQAVSPTAESFLHQATRNVWTWFPSTGERRCP